MSEDIKQLLLGKFTPLKKLKRAELQEEVKMWRNIWGWVPSVVKYYVSRTGQQVGLSIRNYKRFIGILLDTHWQLTEIEIGCYDKVYDQVTGQYYFERKIVKFPATQIVAWDWIAERVTEKEFQAKAEEEAGAEEPEEPHPRLD